MKTGVAAYMHLGRVAHVVSAPKSSYNKNIDGKSADYTVNKQIMICTIKKLYARSVYKTR